MARKIWFRPLGRGYRQGSLVLVPVEVDENHRETQATLIVTIPRSCGQAVRRNRFRRIARAYISQRQGGKDLWLRLLGHHRLDRTIRMEDWASSFDKALSALS